VKPAALLCDSDTLGCDSAMNVLCKLVNVMVLCSAKVENFQNFQTN